MNMLRTRYILACLAVLLTAGAYGQNKKVTFTGAGRLLLNSDRVHGDLFDSAAVATPDTVTAQRELGGYALFDLGFDIRPNAQTEIRAITRINSDLDGFWGAGIAFTVRELYARGLIKGAVRYKIGDIDTKATPYTLWNNQRDLGVNTASALNVFGDVIDYEMFYRDNMWRQQGADLDFALMMPKLVDELQFRGMISKNRNTDYFSLPDRMFALGQLTAVNGDWGEVGDTYASMCDIAASAQFSESASTTDVHTVRFDVGLPGDRGLRLGGELGRSGTRYEETFGAPADTSGSFFDVNLKAQLPNSPWQVRLGYRMVESGFRSPGAQSRQLNVGRTPDAFSFLTNQEIARPMGIGDILKDPTLYNLTFGPELQNYDPSLENAEPYGVATPNRQGVTVGLAMEQDSSVLRTVNIEGGLLTEVQGRGIDAYRNFAFARVRAGIVQGPVSASAAFQFQQTNRDGLTGQGEGLDGIGQVALNSIFAELGVAYEIAPKMDIVGAFLFFAADGNEYTAIRNSFNQITDYREMTVDRAETLSALGLRYRFSDTVQLTVQQHWRGYEDAIDAQLNYNMNQFVVLYNMFF